MKNYFTVQRLRLSSAAIIALAILTYSLESMTYGNSQPPASTTGAPGESTCGSCHSSSSATTSAVVLKFNGKVVTEYVPDSTYTVELSFRQTGITKYGFQTTVLDSATESNAGTLTSPGSLVAIQSQSVNSKSRTYVNHTSSSVNFSGGTGTWTFTWRAPKTQVGSINFYTCVNAANGNGGSSGDQPYTSVIKVPLTKRLPTATVKANLTNVCEGDTVEFTATATNSPTAYNWTPFNAKFSSKNANKIKVVFNANANKTSRIDLTVSNAVGTSPLVTTTITVRAKPADTFAIRGPVNICSGDSFLLAAPLGNTYLWNTGATSQSIYIKAAGKYNVSVSNGGKCSNVTTDLIVTLSAKPFARFTTNATKDTICSGGDSLRFTSNSGSGFYRWYRNGVIFASGTNKSKAVFTPAPGVYTMSIVTVGGCKDSTPVGNTIRLLAGLAKPVPNASNVKSSSFDVTWLDVNNATGYQVSLDSGKNWVSSNMTGGLGHSFTSLTKTIYVVWVRATKGSVNSACGTSSVATLSVSLSASCIAPVYTASIQPIYCRNGQTQVVVRGLNLKKYSLNLAGKTAAKDTIFTVSPKGIDTIIQLVITDTTKGCTPTTQSLTSKVEVILAPRIKNTLATLSGCSNKNYSLNFNRGYDRYDVYSSIQNTLIQSSVDSVMVINGSKLVGLPGIYLRATSKLGCIYTSTTQLLSISNQPNPVVAPYALTSTGWSVTDNSVGTIGTQWYFFKDPSFGTGVFQFSGSPASTSKNWVNTLTNFDSAYYRVAMVASITGGCSDTVFFGIPFSRSTNISNSSANIATVQVYPNPVHSNLNFVINATQAGQYAMVITSTNGGQIIYRQDMNYSTPSSKTYSINTNDWKSGTYIIQLYNGYEVISSDKIIKE